MSAEKEKRKCHTELHPMANIYGLRRALCPVCGGYFYEDSKISKELYILTKEKVRE
jgi:hypothetical protein